MAEEPDETTERISNGTKIVGKVKRGSGTRDQDTLKIVGRGKDADEAAADFEAALSEAEDKDWAERLRAVQPEGDDA